MWPDETELLADLLDAVEFTPEQPLESARFEDDWPAVYVWTYHGHRGTGRLLAAYHRHLTLTGWPIYVGSAKNMRTRRGRHLRNLAEVRDISADEIDIVAVRLPSHAASLYAEQLLIDAYEPVLNEVLAGVGSSWAQGRNRVSQTPSKFALAHRRRGISDEHPARLVDELIDRAEAHLERTVRGVRRIRMRRENQD